MIKIKPIKITGSWKLGYFLDYHTIKSDFSHYDEFGHHRFNNEHTEMGKLLYQLKYKSDKSVIPEIVDTVTYFIREKAWKIDFIIPVPPNNINRKVKPSIDVAKGISDSLGIPFCDDCIRKIKETSQIKNVNDYNERIMILEGSYRTDRNKVLDKRVLLIDDLYR